MDHGLPTTLRRGAAVALFATAAVHVAIVGEYFREACYLGLLFVLGAVASVAAGVRLWQRRDVLAWVVGALVCTGMFAGFVLSRTVGLPGFHEEEWEFSGLVTLALEGGFFALFVAAVSRAWFPARTS